MRFRLRESRLLPLRLGVCTAGELAGLRQRAPCEGRHPGFLGGTHRLDEQLRRFSIRVRGRHPRQRILGDRTQTIDEAAEEGAALLLGSGFQRLQLATDTFCHRGVLGVHRLAIEPVRLRFHPRSITHSGQFTRGVNDQRRLGPR